MKATISAVTAGLLTAAFVGMGVVTSAPASAGCVYGGGYISKCDDPVQPDGSWQRCVGIASVVPSGFGTHLIPVRQCAVMGPGRPGGDPAFNDPPVHIEG
ncbi:CDGP domain-containing protein [Mycolicibacterium obuense]|uniref:CDGP domain-containing protein n=2 Tax=Mycolicibacterium obuense TaxID=1807 RepID=A0A0J6WJJ6_9MYCO|nr:hypothetical protein [Mycolicibacterium obuense]KMO81902.1 hypothetical protein MOBUDSM44075_00024 [Mycolicibacterium obuense]OKH65271.1 hypothetical protein EB72_07005 [Mycobacterium sp. SWH-M1]